MVWVTNGKIERDERDGYGRSAGELEGDLGQGSEGDKRVVRYAGGNARIR